MTPVPEASTSDQWYDVSTTLQAREHILPQGGRMPASMSYTNKHSHASFAVLSDLRQCLRFENAIAPWMGLSAYIGCKHLAGAFFEMAELYGGERGHLAQGYQGNSSLLHRWQLVGTLVMNNRFHTDLDARSLLDPIAFGAVCIRRAASLSKFGSVTQPNGSQPSGAYYLSEIASPTPNGAAARTYALAEGGKVQYAPLSLIHI